MTRAVLIMSNDFPTAERRRNQLLEQRLLMNESSPRNGLTFRGARMGMLMPLGAVLIVVGVTGSATACFQNDSYRSDPQARQPTGQTDTQAAQGDESGASVILAPMSGLLLAAGGVMMGVGAGNWKRPIPSDIRPANPWSDQPKEHGEPPKGLV